MVKRVQVIVNPAAGRGNLYLRALYDTFSKAGVEWDMQMTRWPGHATEIARAAREAGVDVVAAYGGDGTLREVAGALIGSDVPLAILPGGTGNVFATELGIPRNLRWAAHLIVGPHTVRSVDVGMAADEPFLVATATGIIANTMREADREMKERLGYAAYLIVGLREMIDPQPAAYRLSFNGTDARGEGVACLVSNTASFGISGVTALPGTDISDGILDVVLFPASDIQTVLALAATAAGLEDLAAPLPRWRTQHLVLHADPPQPITCDGDIVGQTPVEIRVLHRALKVIAPPHSREPHPR